jgi:hypothetical protein
VGRQPVLAAYGWWFPSLKKSISANELIRGRRPLDSESLVAIGKLWLALRAIRSSTRQVSRIAFAPGIEAHTSASDSQNIGEAQVN